MSVTPTLSPTPTASPVVATLDGRPTPSGQVVVIKVDNSPSARPLQTGFAHAPVVYQVIDGMRQAVSGHYVLLPEAEASTTNPRSPHATPQIVRLRPAPT